MDEFVARQLRQMCAKIADFRQGAIAFNDLIQQLESLARVIGQSFWEDSIFPLVVDLERINSELIDKRRDMTIDERNEVEAIVTSIDSIACDRLR